MSKQFYFKQFSLARVHSLNVENTSGQCGLWSDHNEGVVHIPQNSSITGVSPTLFSVIYHTLLGKVLLFCREAVSVFCNPSRLGKSLLNFLKVIYRDLIRIGIYMKFKKWEGVQMSGKNPLLDILIFLHLFFNAFLNWDMSHKVIYHTWHNG